MIIYSVRHACRCKCILFPSWLCSSSSPHNHIQYHAQDSIPLVCETIPEISRSHLRTINDWAWQTLDIFPTKWKLNRIEWSFDGKKVTCRENQGMLSWWRERLSRYQPVTLHWKLPGHVPPAADGPQPANVENQQKTWKSADLLQAIIYPLVI